MDEWVTEPINNLGTFMKGAPLSKADISEEGTPFILYGELYTTYKEVARDIQRKTAATVDGCYYSKAGDVIIPTSGETAEDIATATCVMTPDVILAGDLNIFRGDKLDGRFLSYVINHKANRAIARVAQGKSVVHVRADEIGKIKIKFPSDKEQTKILTFVELLDDKIGKQQQLIETLKLYKRGLIADIFQQKTPLWNNQTFCTLKTISECLKYEQPQKYIVASEQYDDSYPTPVLTANKGFILGYTNENEGIYNNGDVVIYDDFTMDMKYVRFAFKVKSSTIKMLKAKDDNDLYFMYSYLLSMQLKPEGHQRSYISKIEPMKILIPESSVQRKISDLLQHFDCYIEKETTILEKMYLTKTGLLQQLFI